MEDIVFISDLHLMPQKPEAMKLFIRFADEVAAKADTLYILGDFLEIWWGDDEPATDYADVFRCLTELSTKHDTKVYLM
ncbi:MAG: UDP-2,3-diacylglucosamine diphosphatase, partial [Thiotrichaceae bacterium]|nr:UDP-2,3-diacylglucosamine diphosphatase [Thiotrichaceae bacterium]